jgi:hypothetical protein
MNAEKVMQLNWEENALSTCSAFFVDRLCGLVVRVSGYRSISPGFDSRRYQIFWEVVGLERRPQPREYNWGATSKK